MTEFIVVFLILLSITPLIIITATIIENDKKLKELLDEIQKEIRLC